MRQWYYGHFIDGDCKPFKKLGFSAQTVEQCPDPETMLSTLVGGLPILSTFLSGHVRIRRKICGDILYHSLYLNCRI